MIPPTAKLSISVVILAGEVSTVIDMRPEVQAESRAGRLEAINASWAYDDLINDVLQLHRVDVQHLLQPPRISITRAPHHDDVRKATDYLGTLGRSGLRLAVRVRSFGHLGRYGGEFVMRDNAPDGTPTEADKILTDPTSANLYLYAFTDIVGNRFAQYLLVDLIRLRAVWADDAPLRRPPDFSIRQNARRRTGPLTAATQPASGRQTKNTPPAGLIYRKDAPWLSRGRL